MSIARQKIPLQLDADINPELIKSNIIRRLLNEYHSFIDNGEYYFIDPQNRFFFGWLDTGAEYNADIEYVLKDIDVDGEYRPLPKMSIMVATLRVFYTVKHHRGKNLQRQTFERIIEIAEEEAETFSVFADPFIINNGGGMRETNARSALVKFVTNHYSEPADWKEQLIKQRNRFLSYGLRNCNYEDAQITHPCQSFLFCPTTADDETKELVDRLEIFYKQRADG
jgi:hypothetical protein